MALVELWSVRSVMEAKADILALIIAVDKLIFMLNPSFFGLFALLSIYYFSSTLNILC